MKITQLITTAFQKYIPSPFTIAIILTLITIVWGCVAGTFTAGENRLFAVLSYWENGIWNNNLLVFGYQMMLILVLGHILVLSTPVDWAINKLTQQVYNTTSAVVWVSITTMLVSFFNWGLGLIFGALLARKIGEASLARNFSINYPLVGAAGYVGLMVWHGGISGSAPSKVSEQGHIATLLENTNQESLLHLPASISYNQTIFSSANLIIFAALLIIIPLLLAFVAKKTRPTKISLPLYTRPTFLSKNIKGVDRLEISPYFGFFVGIIVLFAFIVQYLKPLSKLLITPNMLNFFMLGLALLLHRSIYSFLAALEEAIKGTSGILIQFPLYFGIMGIMNDTGIITDISNFFVAIATPSTLPIITFFSAGLVNIFVPSGGGQWAIQGPIIIKAALEIGVPLPKAIMALAYGDQVTNMLQPFWALPLLAITKLKANELLPYTLLLMLAGSFIYILGLIFL